MPGKLGIQLTELCGPNCAICAGLDRRRSLPPSDFERALLEARALGVDRVVLSGGEPLVHEDLNAVVEIALAIRIEVEVVATGYRIDQREPALRRLGPLLKMMWAEFHGGTPETHERVTGRPGSFRDARSVLAVASELGVARGARLVPTPEALAETASFRESVSRFEPTLVFDRSTSHLPRAARDLRGDDTCGDRDSGLIAVVAASGRLYPCFASLGAGALDEALLPSITDDRLNELMKRWPLLDRALRCSRCGSQK